MRDASLPSPAAANCEISESPDGWDFLTGRGPGATAADRSFVAQQRAAWVLGWALAGNSRRWPHAAAFWEHAERIAGSGHSPDATQAAARLYVPRRSKHRAAITRLLYVASRHVDNQIWGAHDVMIAGTAAYLPDAEPGKGEPRYAMRPDALRTIDLGALLVARRGARLCMQCALELSRSGRRRDYCDPCYRRLNRELGKLGIVRHREAIRTVLDRAAPVILSRPALTIRYAEPAGHPPGAR